MRLADGDFVRVSTAVGTLTGIVRTPPSLAAGVVRFDAVRYGDREAGLTGRFAPARSPSADRAQDASSAVFPQQPGGLDWLLGPALGEPPRDERAHLLSIWAPIDTLRDDRPRPVLVYLPGGAFLSGGPCRWYDGARLAAEADAVVVIVGYRLGVLGLLAPLVGGEPANLPVRDALLALQWVADNIASLGGDPGAVTLVGESAGAWLAWLLSQEPAATGLVRRTAVLSLPFEPPHRAADREARLDVVDRALDEAGTTLATASIDEVLSAQRALARAFAGRGMAVFPQAGPLVPADLSDAAAVAERLHVEALLTLTASDEAVAFIGAAPDATFAPDASASWVRARFAPDSLARVESAIDDRVGPQATPKQRLAAAMTLQQFALMQREVADAASGAGIATYAASFDVPTTIPGVGAAHSAVLPYVFGDRHGWFDAPMIAGIDDAAFERVSSRVRAMLAGFVRAGVPSHVDGAPYDRYDPAHAHLTTIEPDATGTAPACPRFERA